LRRRALDAALERTLEWLLARADPASGLITDERDLVSRTNGQGFATLARSQIWCQSPKIAVG
jgi:hypothetical protein